MKRPMRKHNIDLRDDCNISLVTSLQTVGSRAHIRTISETISEIPFEFSSYRQGTRKSRPLEDTPPAPIISS